MPASVHRRFKIEAANRGMSMVDLFMSSWQLWLEKNSDHRN
ncbi:hypothetical protein [Pannonibacter tanglangensis]|nr:hypothetical protein [Pannonibacter sp. XCT-34]